MRPLALAAALLILLTAAPATGQRVLFDASHGETAGNADWIIDADTSQQSWLNYKCERSSFQHSAQRFPTPPQSEITLTTPEAFWDGGISAWAMDLVKDRLNPERGRDWQIEQYPWDAPEMTYGDPTNSQDLANYDVLVLCEPNILFTDAEAQAIREFVWNGGGLFLVADHETSDRNCSGGNQERHDSPFILNRMMQTAVETSRSQPYYLPEDPDNDYGIFGIWFYENDNDDSNDGGNKDFDWFTEAINNNVTPDADDPIVRGAFGDGSGGLGLFGSTQLAVSTRPEKGNPTARVHVWRNGQAQEQNAAGVWERVTLASASYGTGRVVAVGDSSPADDNTGEGNLHPGWDLASGGVANDRLFLNATEWLANPVPDVDPPVITSGPRSAAEDCRATLTWVTDEPADATVEWGTTDALGERITIEDFTTGHEVALADLDPEQTYFFRVASADRAGNGPTVSDRGTFTTGPTTCFAFSAEPAAVEISPVSATIAWATSKVTRGRVRFHIEGEAERSLTSPATVSHRVELTALEPASTYRFRVEATDACGQTVASVAQTFETPELPPSRDLSGWRLVNTNANFEYTFPAGTEIAAGGFVVVGRDADRAAFEAEWGVLDPAVIYLDSDNKVLINSTERPYRLLDAGGDAVDGPTIEIGSGRSLQRREACTDAGDASAWSDVPRAAGAPGRAALDVCGAGVIISEMTDGEDFKNEFVEIYFDP